MAGQNPLVPPLRARIPSAGTAAPASAPAAAQTGAPNRTSRQTGTRSPGPDKSVAPTNRSGPSPESAPATAGIDWFVLGIFHHLASLLASWFARPSRSAQWLVLTPQMGLTRQAQWLVLIPGADTCRLSLGPDLARALFYAQTSPACAGPLSLVEYAL